jgi:hypothetical protein
MLKVILLFLVHYLTIISLVLILIVVIGIFGLKKVSLVFNLTISFPILMLIFND